MPEPAPRIVSELVTFLGLSAAPRHPIPPRPSLPDPSCEVCFLPLAPRPLTEGRFLCIPRVVVDQFKLRTVRHRPI